MLSKKKVKDLWKEWVDAEATMSITKRKGDTSCATVISGDKMMVDTLFSSLTSKLINFGMYTKEELFRLIEAGIKAEAKAREMSDNESK